ncbi:peptidase [Streptococcus sp. 20-1249]|uniref:peptidase n=1 Tax=Streptococcus hepaticus TaxID=3349163 RepID=UPI002987FF8E
MQIIESYLRVAEKADTFSEIFGYRLVAPIFPVAAIYGPQEESDIFEAKLDKCIKDKYDYFEDEYGYDSDEKDVDYNVKSMYFTIVNIIKHRYGAFLSP